MQATVPAIESARLPEIEVAAERDCALSTSPASVPGVTLDAVLRR